MMSKNMSKIIAFVLVLVLSASLAAACRRAGDSDPTPTPMPTAAPVDTGSDPVAETPVTEDEPVATEDEPTPEPEVESTMTFNTKVPRDTLIVGTPAMNGDFTTGFGNSSYDLSIKVLTGGHMGTVWQTPDGQLAINNTVVRNHTISFDEAGNKTYNITIYDDLKFNNGETIYAKDFVASMLYFTSPQFVESGGTSSAGLELVGYSAYNDPDHPEHTNVFEGVRLLGDFEFALTIAAEELPYFWEFSIIGIDPIYSSGYFPGIEVLSDENGASFSADILEDCLRIAETERFAPTVTVGPYMFIDFDGTTVNMQRNPHFKGDPNGFTPSFEFVIQTHVPEETDVDMVLAGDIDLNTGNIEGSKIEKAKADPFGVAHSYLRAGYGFIGFMADWGPTADPNVRWAIAHIIDRNAIIDHVLEGYGGLVDAAFGMAQWTYQAKRRELAGALTPIAFNLERANDFLDLSEWVFEADGTTPFDRSQVDSEGNYMRYNADGVMLTINHMSAAMSVGGAIEAETIQNAPLVGMRYDITHAEFSELLQNYYYSYELSDEERFYSAFNLATNFTAVDDKYFSWHSDWLGTWYNAEQLSDPELDRITLLMRELDPSQVDEHLEYWFEFQVRWQELLPQFPLYSNEYFDIYNNVVISVPTTPYANYQDVICEIAKHQ